MVYEHVHHLKSNIKPANCWLAIFNLRLELGVNNALMVAEICLVTPLSNVESKGDFSSLWRNFNKERSIEQMIVWKTFFVCVVFFVFLNSDIIMPLNYFWRNIQMVHFDRELVT